MKGAAAKRIPVRGLAVRAYRESDLRACQAIRRDSFDFNQYLRLPNYVFLVAEDPGGGVVGYTVMQVWQWNRCGWMADLYVRANRRFEGCGRALMDRLKHIAREQGCVMLVDYVPDDADYLPFYFKLGFRIYGYHSHYFYHPDERQRGAIIFGCPLEEGSPGPGVDWMPGAHGTAGDAPKRSGRERSEGHAR